MTSRHFRVVCLLALLLFMAAGGFAQTEDVEGSKDHPMFTRMPGYYIGEYSDEEFGSYLFFDENDQEAEVEGHKVMISYYVKEGEKVSSPLKIIRNYENAIREIGGKVFEYGDHHAYLNLIKDGSEVWCEVFVGEEWYTLTIVEKGEVVQEITASDILSELNKAGHVALYINFDFGKATIKPESRKVIDQVAAMLKQNAELKLNVEGHTDSIGAEKTNLELSEARAKAVVDALVAQKIDAGRLNPLGLGETKPIADNGTDEGRAKNRRVELVKQ